MAKQNKNKNRRNGKPNSNRNNRNSNNRGYQHDSTTRSNQTSTKSDNVNNTPDDVKQGSAVVKANDPNFWMGTELSVNAAKYTTDQPYGAPFDSPEPLANDYTPAGIAKYDFIPFYGYVESSIDSINYVAKLMYDRINSKNSRDWSYDPSDLMIYIIAIANLHALHAFVLRIIGMFNQVFMSNRYIWRPILESMNIKEPDYKAKEGVNTLSAWRDLANDMAILINIFPVPDNIAYFKRIKYMCSNIYFDQNTPKSSISYFNPAGFYGYEYADNIGRLVLRETPWYDPTTTYHEGYKVTIDDIKTYFESLISNLTNDSDITRMTTDIIKAFPDANWLSAPLINESFSIDFTYDPLMNEMIHNARPCYHGEQLLRNKDTGKPVSYEQDMTHNCLTVVDGNIVLDQALPDAWMLDGGRTKSLPLDFSVENPDESLRMYATRLMWYATIHRKGDTNYRHINCTTELIINDHFYEFQRDSEGRWSLDAKDKCLISGFGFVSTDYKLAIEKASRVAKFNNAPINWLVHTGANAAGYLTPSVCKMMCDLSNYTTLPIYNLKRLNHAATVSIFLPRQLDERIKLDDLKR